MRDPNPPSRPQPPWDVREYFDTFSEGAIVNLRFRLTQSDFEVQTRGEVRYCLPGIGIGVEFVGIGTEAVRAIEKELRAFSWARPQKSKKGPGKARNSL